jgi:hypothetical protein
MKKSRVEILRGKLKKMGESDEIDSSMPEDVADCFLAELRFDPDCGAIAARSWRPHNRNEQPWIKEMLDSAGRKDRAQRARQHPLGAVNPPDEPVN